MKPESKNGRKVKQTHFPVWVFAVTLIVLLGMAGIHTLLVLLLNLWDTSDFVKTAIVIFYWVLVSTGFTMFTRQQIKRSFEQPMMELAKAANEVANGDFSVYVPLVHTAEKLDYLDMMIMDFNKMVEELGSIETLKTDFFSNVSHEIKTPLATILNYAESLKNPDLEEGKKQEYIETIIQSSKKLSKLVTNILKLNKLEKQTIQAVEEPYDLCGQLCECALQLEDLWEKKGITFEADIEDRATVEADASLLELVWNNLLSNAVKFTEPGGKVMLRQSSANDKIIVSVADTGCGMDRETEKHIFDKFYQGDTAHSTEGNGLGLALALRVLELVGGTVSVDSKLGKGTVFTVTLPVGRNMESNGTGWII